ncbi:MAG: hypothetical protein AAF228_05960 [Pseudomonadota bacterium]
MKNKIELYHYSLSKDVYKDRLKSNFYKNSWPLHLHLERVEKPTVQFFMKQIKKMDPELFWDCQSKLNDPDFETEYLNGPESEMFMLTDNGRSVGFALVKSMPESLKNKFFAACNNENRPKAIEVNYLGLFNGEAGKKRGKSYFEMLFAQYFKDYDRVYWSQHSTNAPTLKKYYIEKMGMELHEIEIIEDFRPFEARNEALKFAHS